MSNLIPEVRTDKNGKTSTRWVKPEWAKGPSVAKKIPAVTMQGIGSRPTLLRILNGNRGQDRPDLGAAIGRTLTEEKAEELVSFLLMKRETSENSQLQSQVMINIENPRIGKKLNEMIVSHYDNASAEGIHGAFSFLTGIGEMNRDLSTEQEWALLKVTDAASRSDAVERVNVPFPFDAYALRNTELVDLIVDRPELADDIATVMRERKVEDVQSILGLLEGDTHSALTHGAL